MFSDTVDSVDTRAGPVVDISSRLSRSMDRCGHVSGHVMTDHVLTSASKSSIQRFVITEKAPTRASPG